MGFKLLVVNFHYIRELKLFSGIYPISPSQFTSQLEALSKKYTFCSQPDILNWVAADAFPTGDFCLITFDDGLAEQMVAVDILRRKGIPGVFFVPTAPLAFETVLTVHKLQYIRSVLNDDEVFNSLKEVSDIDKYPFQMERVKTQYRYDNELGAKIKFYLNFVVSSEIAENLIGTLFCNLVNENTFIRQFYMRKDDLKVLANFSMLGSHGVHHQPMATLNADEKRFEILESSKFLEHITDSTVQSFSYPFGSTEAVDEATVDCIRDSPIQLAFTMIRGVNEIEDLRGKFLLKRVDTNDAPGGKKALSIFS